MALMLDQTSWVLVLVFDTIRDTVGDGGCDHIHSRRFFNFPSLSGRSAMDIAGIDVCLRDGSTSEMARHRRELKCQIMRYTVSDLVRAVRASLTMVMQ